MNFTESRQAVAQVIKAAEELHKVQGLKPQKLTVMGLHPHVVTEASHTFKTRLWGANDSKNYVHLVYEPFEDGVISINLISRVIAPLVVKSLIPSN